MIVHRAFALISGWAGLGAVRGMARLCIWRYRTSVPGLGCEILCLDHVAGVLSTSPTVNFV